MPLIGRNRYHAQNERAMRICLRHPSSVFVFKIWIQVKLLRQFLVGS